MEEGLFYVVRISDTTERRLTAHSALQAET